MTKKAKDRKKQYQLEAKSQWKKNPLTTDTFIDIILYFGDKRKRDWDNFHKLSMDSLEGIVLQDDAQIQEATVHKEYDKENPRIEIFIHSWLIKWMYYNGQVWETVTPNLIFIASKGIPISPKGDR